MSLHALLASNAAIKARREKKVPIKKVRPSPKIKKSLAHKGDLKKV